MLTASPTYVLGRSFRGSCREDVVMTNEVMASLTYELGSEHYLYALETPSKSLDATASRRRIWCKSGALIRVCGYFIIARVRAGRPCSRPQPESTGLLL
ncbi:hypothetical protein Sjap_014120 [Stephania japonica]|uniref:Uncharacterized protein n=1 Tax=Stephania japonica TaxID=461633 RepID=A0AAP0J118_9MAGN